jgi:hypothetical protein
MSLIVIEDDRLRWSESTTLDPMKTTLCISLDTNPRTFRLHACVSGQQSMFSIHMQHLPHIALLELQYVNGRARLTQLQQSNGPRPTTEHYTSIGYLHRLREDFVDELKHTAQPVALLAESWRPKTLKQYLTRLFHGFGHSPSQDAKFKLFCQQSKIKAYAEEDYLQYGMH